ncbi:hypothetical protein B0G76_2850 [Paraburkholderia sp. BL23I1N1]|uniref:hypothetical protein n=1 Tax=Paraburkholderia sp. BL23I1N1 TaxID=1938802 RepID=UPI000E70D220|nr:hypothetical protein [Paraburkholderia sp. BL23I1N1]RKE36648.1 hypothetical protein B0G76_2850 [Paraburkholderia sp. BL23I1N1]
MDTTAETPNENEHVIAEIEVDLEGQTATTAEVTQPAHGDGVAAEGEEDSEAVIQFGDEEAPASGEEGQENAPQWVKDLRKQNRELTRKLREKEASEAVSRPTQAPAVPTLGPKPKLENFDYDEGKFDAAVGKWYADKAEVDAAAAKVNAEAEARERGNQERLAAYERGAKALRIKDFKELEATVVIELSPVQQGILLAGSDKPEVLVAALGKYPNKLRDLAKITDPVRFAFAAGKLEKELKVSTRNATKAAPEARVSSSAAAPAAGGGEKKLEQLRAEAEKTGDYSKVLSYKAQLKRAQQQR